MPDQSRDDPRSDPCPYRGSVLVDLGHIDWHDFANEQALLTRLSDFVRPLLAEAEARALDGLIALVARVGEDAWRRGHPVVFAASAFDQS